MGEPGEQQQSETKPSALAQALLRRFPEKNLCHYTTQTGLKGILDSKQLWATDVRFMNDSQEYVYALDLAIQYLKHSPLQSNDDSRKAFAESALKFLDTKDNVVAILNQTPTFVASFSEDPDLLSQWRGYCPGGNGFAICFSPDRIRKLAAAHRWELRRCLYSKTDQDNFLMQLEENALASPIPPLPKQFGVGNKSIQAAFLFAIHLAKYGIALKHPTFKEESEWRAFTYGESNSKEIRIREGKSSLIPYIGFPLTLNQPEAVQIDSLVIGPTPNKELSEIAAKCLLDSKGASSAKIQHSQIPYRHW